MEEHLKDSQRHLPEKMELIRKEIAQTQTHIKKFIEVQYSAFRSEKNVQVCCFLLGLSHLFEFESPDGATLRTKLDYLEKLWTSPSATSISAYELSCLYKLKLTSFSNKRKEHLNLAEIQEIVSAQAWIAAHPLPHNLQDPLEENQALASLLHFSSDIKRGLQSDQGQVMLNRALRFFTHGDIKWDTAAFPLCICYDGFKEGRYFFNVLEGTLYEKGTKISSLPPSISNKMKYHIVFGKEVPTVKFCPPGTYTFLDGLTRIRQQAESFCIQKQLKKDGRWYENVDADDLYPSSSSIERPLGTKDLVDYQKYTHWISEKSDRPSEESKTAVMREILIVDRKSQNITHRIICEGSHLQISSIEKLQADKEPLQLVDIYHQPTSFSFLQSIEDLAYVHVWANKNAPALIEIPRLDLDFTIAKDSENALKAHCTSIPGYYIAQEQRLRSLANFRNFLVLEDHAGDKRKILIPRRNIRVTKEGCLSCAIRLKSSNPYEDSFLVSKYLIYNVDSQGKVVCQDQEQSLYMAYLCLGMKQYAQALVYLRENARKLKSYTPQEIQLFTWIHELQAKNLDKDPKACAVYLCAKACLLKNAQLSDQPEEKPAEFAEEQQKLRHTYFHNYLPVAAYATTLQLTQNEEALLLKYFNLPQTLRDVDPSLEDSEEDQAAAHVCSKGTSYLEGMALLHTSARVAKKVEQLEIIPKKKEKEELHLLASMLTCALSEEDSKMGVSQKHIAENFSLQLLGQGNRFLNPRKEIVQSLLSKAYVQAKRRDIEIEPLLNILKASQDNELKLMHKLLQAVYLLPHLFPSWESMQNGLEKPLTVLSQAFQSIQKQQNELEKQKLALAQLKRKQTEATEESEEKSAAIQRPDVWKREIERKSKHFLRPSKSTPLDDFKGLKDASALHTKKGPELQKMAFVPLEKLRALFAPCSSRPPLMSLKDKEDLLEALSADEVMHKDTLAYLAQAPLPNFILLTELKRQKVRAAWTCFIFKHERGLIDLAKRVHETHHPEAPSEEAEVKNILQNATLKSPGYSPINVQTLLHLLDDEGRSHLECPVLAEPNLALFKRIAKKAFAAKLPAQVESEAKEVWQSKLLDLSQASQSATHLYRNLAIQAAHLKKQAMVSEFHLLDLANKSSQTSAGVIRGVAELATQLNKITLADLMLAFVQKNSVLTQLNPFLNAEDVAHLMQLTMHYLLQKTQLQKIERTLIAFKELEALKHVAPTSPEKQAITNRLYAELEGLSKEGPGLSERPYDPAVRPAYLLFEYCSGFTLRADQVLKLEQMVAPTGNPHVILQMIMGAGKTKVLLPILAMQNADGHHLSTIVVPEALFESVLKDIQEASHKVFQQATHVLYFNRNTELSEEKLTKIYTKLKNICRQRHYLLISSKSLACIALKYQEALYNHSQGKSASSTTSSFQIKWLRKILLLFKEKGKAIIDEADLILNCRAEVNFSIGTPDSVKEEHRNVTISLFEYLLSLEEVFRKTMPEKILPEGTYHVFSDMTESIYHTTLKPRLTEKIVQAMQVHFGKDGESLILSYLANTQSKEEQAEIAKAPQRHVLALYRQQLNQILPLTLSKVCDTHYGFSEKSCHPLAIPYSNGTPNESSQFGNPYELQNYTLLAYLLKGVDKKIVEAHIQVLQSKALQERAQHPERVLEDTGAYREFMELCGTSGKWPFLKCPEEDLIALTKALNATRHLPSKDNRLMAFIRKFALPEVKVHPAKLSINAQGLVDLFLQTQGFTGTPWNSDTFHEKITLLPDLGVDGKSMAILWSQCQGQCHKLELPPTSSIPAKLEAVLVNSVLATQRSQSHFQAIIDTGGIFKGLDNQVIAQELLKGLPETIKGISYFQGDQLVMLEKGKTQSMPFEQSSLRKEERFTFYDQRHTTGTDIEQPPCALAVVTIGKDVTSRDLAQGMWRMRGLGQGQRVALVYLPALEEILRQALPSHASREKAEKEEKEGAIDLKHIVHLINHNQAKQRKEHCIAVVKHKIRHIVESQLLHRLLHKRGSLLSSDPLLTQAIKLFAKPVVDEPFAIYGQIEQSIPKKQFVQAYSQAVLSAYISKGTDSLKNPELLALQMCLVARLELLPEMLTDRTAKTDRDNG